MPSSYDIVLVPFPFTDLSSVKLRPALIVANPYGDDVIVAFISSKSEKVHANDLKVAHTKENGLKKDSVINCAKLATLDQKMLVGKLGSLEEKHKGAVQKKLQKVFGL